MDKNIVNFLLFIIQCIKPINGSKCKKQIFMKNNLKKQKTYEYVAPYKKKEKKIYQVKM